MLYRYEYQSGCELDHTGILIGLDEIVKDEFRAFQLEFMFIQDLERPIDDLRGTISYFTEKGNRHFSKAIRAIKKEAKKHGINVVCIIEEKSNIDILYEDKYQVIGIRYDKDE